MDLPTMMSEPALRYRGRSYVPRERGVYGAIITLVDTSGGGLLTRAFTGCTAKEAAKEAVVLCDQLGPTWRIRCISHPLTIEYDLGNYGRERGAGPESSLLAKLGRPDLNERFAKWYGHTTKTMRDRRRKA